MEVANQHLGAEERATWCVGMFIGGNYEHGEATCRRWESMVAGAVENYDLSDPLVDRAIRKENAAEAAHELASALKDWLEEERGEDQGVFGDMLGYMMACVDFEQLAEDAIEEEVRQ